MRYSKQYLLTKCCIPALTILVYTPHLWTQATQTSPLQELCIASQNGKLRTVKKILSQDPTLINKRFSTPGNFKGTALHYAVGPLSTTNHEVLTYLLEQGCNPNNQKNKKKNTPLHRALSSKKKLTYITELVYAGTKLSLQNNLGETPLHCAVYNGDCSIITLLLANGARLDIPNKKNQTASTQPVDPKALQRNSSLDAEIAELLRSAQLFYDVEDKVTFITTSSDNNVIIQGQQLCFRALVESGELDELVTLYHMLSYKNPKLLTELLQHVPIKIKPRALKKLSLYYAALCNHWIRMPRKLVPFVVEGKLDKELETLKIMLPRKKISHTLLTVICERLKKINLNHEQKYRLHTDLTFRFGS